MFNMLFRFYWGHGGLNNMQTVSKGSTLAFQTKTLTLRTFPESSGGKCKISQVDQDEQYAPLQEPPQTEQH